MLQLVTHDGLTANGQSTMRRAYRLLCEGGYNETGLVASIFPTSIELPNKEAKFNQDPPLFPRGDDLMTPTWWCTLVEQYKILALLCCFTSLVSAQSPKCPTNATATVQQPSGWKYLGCYHDTWNDRLLKASSVKLLNNTVVGCANICSSQGHTVFGVEYSRECYCDTSLHPNASTSLSEQAYCNGTCCGDASVLCGGTWYIDVYQVSSSGGNFTKRNRIIVGISIGVVTSLAAVILGWKYYNRRYLSKSQSLLPRFRIWTRIGSGFKAEVKVADRRPKKRLFGRLKNPLQRWQDRAC